MLLAEANQWPADLRAYFGEGDEFHMAFHFPLMPRMFMGLKLEDRKPITEILKQTPQIPASCQWCLFLRNHDELTLEMVTDMERDYMYDQYARDKHMRINVGIRRRLAPLLDNDRRRIELMNGMLMSLPGTPIIYYGDEIGMGDNIYLGDRNGVRTPMQWDAGLERRLLDRRSRKPLFSAHAQSGLRLPGGQRPVAKTFRPLAALLDEAHRQGAKIHAGVRPGIDRFSLSREPPDSGLRAPTWKKSPSWW